MLRRSSTKRHYRNEPDDLTVLAVLRRASGRCEMCGGGIRGDRGFDWSVHHRRFRDSRPDTHSPQNLLLVDGGDNTDRCHGRIHRSKADAMTYGWAITRHGNADPLTIPVLIDFGARWVYLTASGEYADNPGGVDRA